MTKTMFSKMDTGWHDGRTAIRRWIASSLGLLLVVGGVSDAPGKTPDFSTEILPILRQHCWECHGPDQQESAYRLDQRASALQRADLGEPPIVPGDSGASPLIRFISGTDPDLVMPPAGKPRLDATQIELLTHWIDAGADWPDAWADSPSGQNPLTTDHWSFQPIRKGSIPARNQQNLARFDSVGPVDDDNQATNDASNAIDLFIAEKLAAAGLRFSLPADRVTWIRRLYLDMHGLLPTPEERDSFVGDDHPDAFSRAIERVLESRRYGERWGRHWLDVVRFGESTGFEVNRDRPHAYPYRDYVIDALNEDKPYSQFVMEQIAGDSLQADAATGFLVGGPYDMVKSPDVQLTLMQRQDELADMVNTTATTFLGLTVGCARCHHHKFDPIRQQDYYAMQAVFAGVDHGERPLYSQVDHQIVAQIERFDRQISDWEQQLANYRDLARARKQASSNRNSPASMPSRSDASVDSPDSQGINLSVVNSRRNEDVFPLREVRFVRFTIRATNGAEPCLDELEIYRHESDVNVALASRGSRATSSGNFPDHPLHRLDHINDGQHGNRRSWISNQVGAGWVSIELPQNEPIDRVVWGRDREGQFADRLATEYSIEGSLDGSTWTMLSSSARRPRYSDSQSKGQEPEDAFLSELPPESMADARDLLNQLVKIRQARGDLHAKIPIGYVGTFRTHPEPIHRLHRGDPMSPREIVEPGPLQVIGELGFSVPSSEQERRLALARWIVDERNPLTARVIVNRVWHYHFGTGLVSTPSDFGKNGAVPTHPELLDYLAAEFMEHGWSLKWLHRQIVASRTYRQQSYPESNGLTIDANCRWLWRFPPRRLEAEAIRDCVLQATGKLNLKAGGPGFFLLKVDRENVHHYFPLESFGPEEFRRMVYMTKIRQEQDDVFGIFDCPDGGQVVPDRSRSTTPLQALNLLNSQFMIEQAGYLAARLQADVAEIPSRDTRRESMIERAFDLLFLRQPNELERVKSLKLIEEHGLEAFCRALLNSNEFLFLG